jgi:hypothetical protein
LLTCPGCTHRLRVDTIQAHCETCTKITCPGCTLYSTATNLMTVRNSIVQYATHTFLRDARTIV